MRIQNNITAQNSHRQYGINVASQSKDMEKLSSGYRVNRAADDAAGLAISEKMRTQIRGLSQAANNIQDGCSLLQVADAAMQTASDIIQRMREIAVQSANGTNADEIDREALDLEYQQLMSELDDLANTTNFNGVYPLKGVGVTNPRASVVGGNNVSPGGTISSPTYTGAANYPGGPDLPAPGASLSANPPAGFEPNTANTDAAIALSTSITTGTMPTVTTGSGSSIPPIGTGTTTISTPGIFEIDGANIANGAIIEIPAGATLIITGTVTNDILFKGDSVSGTTGKVQINGNVTGKVTNYADIVVDGAGGNIVNHGDMRITGTDTQIAENNGRILVTGDNATITQNNGDIRATGSMPSPGTINIGTNDGNIRSQKRAVIGTNSGEAYLELSTNHTITNNTGDARIITALADVKNNSGNLRITADDASVGVNSGHLYVQNPNPTIGTNTGTGVVWVAGSSNPTIGDNQGKMYIYGSNSNITSNSGELILYETTTSTSQTIGTNSGKAQIVASGVTVTTNTGELGISGDTARGITGNNATVINNGTANNANAKLFISGDVAEITNNYATAHIQNPSPVAPAPNLYITNNHGSGKALLESINAFIDNNNGTLEAKGNGTKIEYNNAGSNVRFTSDNAARIMINNGGRIEVASGSTIEKLGMNLSTGVIVVENGGIVNDILAKNEGRIEVAAGGTLDIDENMAGATIVSHGTTILRGDNSGNIDVGKGIIGTLDSAPFVEIWGDNTSTGIIRNFSDNKLSIGTNAGYIDNYGRIDPTPTGGTIRHHVYDADVDAIDPFNEGTQTITVIVNGEPIELTATWSGEKLEFPLPDPLPESFGDGTVIFDALPKYAAVANTRYDVQPRVEIPFSSGASGYGLVFTFHKGFYIQSGANEGDATELSFRPMGVRYLAVDEEDEDINLGSTHIRDMENASNALTVTWNAVNDISLYRAELGAQYNRLEYTYANVTNSTENIAAAESRIRDTDMAKQMTFFTKNNILMQSSTAMLAQANALPQGVLQLLG